MTDLLRQRINREVKEMKDTLKQGQEQSSSLSNKFLAASRAKRELLRARNVQGKTGYLVNMVHDQDTRVE